MAENDNNNGRNGTVWKSIVNKPTPATLLVSLIGWIGFTAYYQITYNERQNAAIVANALAIKDFRDQIYMMQTPLGVKVLGLEQRINTVIQQMDHLNNSIDRISERTILQDRKLMELEIKSKKRQ